MCGYVDLGSGGVSPPKAAWRGEPARHRAEFPAKIDLAGLISIVQLKINRQSLFGGETPPNSNRQSNTVISMMNVTMERMTLSERKFMMKLLSGQSPSMKTGMMKVGGQMNIV